jgi:hypothetical protein
VPRSPVASEPEKGRLRQRFAIRLLGAFGLALTGVVGAAFVATPAFASGSLTNVSLAISSNLASATPVQYTLSLSTATSNALTSVTFSVPAGTTLTGATTTAYGAGADTASSALASNLVTETLTGGATIAAGTNVSFVVTGFTNTATPGAFTSTVTTLNAATAIDTGTSNSNTVTTTGTAVTIEVPESVTVTVPPAFTIVPIVGSTTTAAAEALSIASNAGNGFSAFACVTTPFQTGTLVQLVQGSSTVVGPLINSFGAFATSSGSGTLQGLWTTASNLTHMLGYNSACTATNDGLVYKDTLTTNGDTVNFTNGANIAATTGSGIYTGTITYQVTPSF